MFQCVTLDTHEIPVHVVQTQFLTGEIKIKIDLWKKMPKYPLTNLPTITNYLSIICPHTCLKL